jgi:hypothetical protein
MNEPTFLQPPNARLIEPTDNITPSEFWFHRVFRDRPLLIRKSALGVNARKKWTLDYLRLHLAETPVVLSSSGSGVFDYNVGDSIAQTWMPFSEAIDEIASCEARGCGYAYVQQHAISTKSHPLLSDAVRPDWLDPITLVHVVNLWLGSRGCFSPLHYDKADNFLMQVLGRKQLILFDKTDARYLYPNVGQQYEHLSMIDLSTPDHVRFPLMKHAQPYTVLIEPGDVLYIPRRWWHAVYSLDTAVSVNYWWSGAFAMASEGIRLIPELLSKRLRNPNKGDGNP